MKNIHLLPTDKPSRLWFYKQFAHLLTGLTVEKSKDIHPQHIYITSDEEIKGKDIVIEIGSSIKVATIAMSKTNDGKWKKIVLTTDESLIADGVQAIDDDFFEWYIQNPNCEEIEVIHGLFNLMEKQVDPMNLGQNHSQCVWKYKIIIPKEEPNKTHYLDELPNMDREVLAKMWESAMPKLKPKQETLEEAVERLIKLNRQDAFYEGAKWQQERSYSEEEVLELLHKRMIYTLGEEYKKETTLKWFEQFKKKTQ